MSATVAADGASDFSVRLLRSFLALCENPRTRHGMLRMVRASAPVEEIVRQFAPAIRATLRG